MPILNGVEAVREIRASVPVSDRAIIVAVTAHAFLDERQEMLDAGCDDFLSKPFKPVDLFEVLERQLPLRVVRPTASPVSAMVPDLDPKAVSRLPESLRRNFLSALERSDMTEIATLISQIRELDATLGMWLQQQADRFDYSLLIRALEETSHDQTEWNSGRR